MTSTPFPTKKKSNLLLFKTLEQIAMSIVFCIFIFCFGIVDTPKKLDVYVQLPSTYIYLHSDFLYVHNILVAVKLAKKERFLQEKSMNEWAEGNPKTNWSGIFSIFFSSFSPNPIEFEWACIESWKQACTTLYLTIAIQKKVFILHKEVYITWTCVYSKHHVIHYNIRARCTDISWILFSFQFPV